MPLKYIVSAAQPTPRGIDVLVIPKTTGEFSSAVPLALARPLSRTLRERKFKGAWGSATFLVQPYPRSAPFVAVVGLGDKEPLARQAEALRRGLAQVVQDARRHNLKRLGVVIPAEGAAALTAALVESVELANYRFTEYSKTLAAAHRRQRLQEVTLFVTRPEVSVVRESLATARSVMQGVELVRNLVNQPADNVSPKALVDVARGISQKVTGVTVKVLNRQQAAAEGFNAFLAVARGATTEPYVIHLTYTPPEPSEHNIFLVGKGITFDSGGLSIKPADFMENMKIDMAGAATVLGVFSILDKIKPRAVVHGVIAACENMPSGNAYRPGDVLTAKNGKTIEVLNTDAEGRITLADALAYAVEHKPTAIIDLATLTGACMVGLGETIAGMWSTSEVLASQVVSAAGAAGEGVAVLPMPEEYRPFIKSQIADVRNTATNRFGGAITAAMFLREFVDDTPWVHLDVAGPVWAERGSLPYFTPGATGYGVRMLINYLRNF